MSWRNSMSRHAKHKSRVPYQTNWMDKKLNAQSKNLGFSVHKKVSF